MGFPKKLLGQDESVVMILRPHVKQLFLPVVVLLVAAPAASFAAGLIPDGSMQRWVRWLIVIAALLVVVRWTVWPFLVWWNTVYVITNRRLIMRHGVLSRSGHDMPLTRLNDVSFSHNIIERMIGCGTLVVESAGERGQVVLADVPKVEQVQRVLYRLSDELRGAGGSGPWAGAGPDDRYDDGDGAGDPDHADDGHDADDATAADGDDPDGRRRGSWRGRRRR